MRDIAQGRTFLASRADGAARRARKPDVPVARPGRGRLARGVRVLRDESRQRRHGWISGRPRSRPRHRPHHPREPCQWSGRSEGEQRERRTQHQRGRHPGGLRHALPPTSRMGTRDTIADVHLRDLSAGTTRLVSAAPGGPKANQPAFAPSIDASGTRVAFEAATTNLLGDTLRALQGVRPRHDDRQPRHREPRGWRRGRRGGRRGARRADQPRRPLRGLHGRGRQPRAGPARRADPGLRPRPRHRPHRARLAGGRARGSGVRQRCRG